MQSARGGFFDGAEAHTSVAAPSRVSDDLRPATDAGDGAATGGGREAHSIALIRFSSCGLKTRLLRAFRDRGPLISKWTEVRQTLCAGATPLHRRVGRAKRSVNGVRWMTESEGAVAPAPRQSGELQTFFPFERP